MVHVTQYHSVLTRATSDWFDQEVQFTANVGEPPGSIDLGWFQYVDSKFSCKGLQLPCAIRVVMVCFPYQLQNIRYDFHLMATFLHLNKFQSMGEAMKVDKVQ